jgi:FMN phosphatase YigB (HAD superfamily)
MNNKLILTDCDGVLLDWEFAFHTWMAKQGYKVCDNHKLFYRIEDQYGIPQGEKRNLVRMFNESAAIGFLPPFRDSVHYVKKLHEQHGYIFHVITSLSTDRYAGELRIKNLRKLFGETTFDKFIILDTGADKDEALEEYRDSECYWIEDHIQNVQVGMDIGLTGILVEHQHNMHHTGCPVVKNWKSIYNYITGSM